VDLPQPVGPVTKTKPVFASANFNPPAGKPISLRFGILEEIKRAAKARLFFS